MTKSNEINQYKLSETGFDNEVFYGTYLYNQINVFVNSYDCEEGVVELMSCDDRYIDGEELSVALSLEEFIKTYLQ